MSFYGEPDAQAGRGADLHGKTLALLRRLFVGNGYKVDAIELKQLEEQDLHIPGTLNLTLQLSENTQRVPGTARGGETQVFLQRDLAAQAIGSYQSEVNSGGSWIEEVRKLVESTPLQGWGLEKGKWPLPNLSRRYALTLPCDLCRGQKYEQCMHCFGQREIMCPQCQGRGGDCPTCRGRGRVVCNFCRGEGRLMCRECQGLGAFTEETTLGAYAEGSFTLGSLASAPPGVSEIVEGLTPLELGEGHAAITPLPQKVEGTALHYEAILPYARFEMKLGNETQEIRAVGMKPLLAEFPLLLDEVFKGVPSQLSSSTLDHFARKYRLIRELAEAMGRGVRPGRFFSQAYPFGLSAPLAFALAARLKEIFSSLSLWPRVLTAVSASGVALTAFALWLNPPRMALPPEVPPVAADGALAVLLAVMTWLVVSFVGQFNLKRHLPVEVSLRAAGGRIALGAAAFVLIGAAALLLNPATQPQWVQVLLR